MDRFDDGTLYMSQVESMLGKRRKNEKKRNNYL